MLHFTQLLLGAVPFLDGEIVSMGLKIGGGIITALFAWRQRRYKTVYGSYFETLHLQNGRRIRGNTVILLRPRLPLPFMPIGLRLDGIYFTKERIERGFHDLGVRIKAGETVAVSYDYAATERGKRFECSGSFVFQELDHGKYQQAHGSFTRPDKNNPDRLRLVNISWDRIPEANVQGLIGKAKISSLKDLRRFVDVVRHDARYDDLCDEQGKAFPVEDTAGD